MIFVPRSDSFHMRPTGLSRRGRRLALIAAFATLGTAAACGAPGSQAGESLSPEQDDARRLSAILDYVAADYPKVLDGSNVVNPAEYAEQESFLRDALEISGQLSPDGGWLPEAVARVARQVSDTAAGGRVASDIRTVRARLVDEYGVRLAPARRPDRSVGVRLYGESCASCHGVTGAGDGPAAAGLVPAPVSFRDAGAISTLSPARAFNAVTDGISGTGMPSFGSLSAQERWSVAFYALSLRHGDDDASRMAAASVPRELLGKDTLAVLAAASDGALLERLTASGLTPPESARALAGLRSDVPFRQQGVDLMPTILTLDEAVRDYEAGDPAGARAKLTSAYLDGIEPVEPALRSRNPELVARLEAGFMTLRDRSREGIPVSAFGVEAGALRYLVVEAETILRGDDGRAAPFVASSVILLREGLEAALLISLLLGLVRQAGGRRDVMVTHLGWISAVALGAATWLASGWVIRMGGARREIVEGGVTLLAAAVLVYASHFVLARADGGRRVRNFKARLAASSPSGRFAVLFGLAFMAVYREAFEVVLFLQAVLVQSPGAGWMVGAGALSGLLLSAALAVVVIRAGARLKPDVILTATGTLLCALVVVMVGKGFHALQEAGVVGLDQIAFPRVDWLGLYPTVQTVGVQLVVLIGMLGLAVIANRRAQPALSSK